MLIGDRDKPQKTGPHTRFTSRRQASGNSSGRLTGQPFLAGLRSGSRSKLQPAADEEEAGPNGVAVCFAKCTIFLFATVTAALGLATLGLGVATFRSLSDLRAQCVNSAPWRPLLVVPQLLLPGLWIYRLRYRLLDGEPVCWLTEQQGDRSCALSLAQDLRLHAMPSSAHIPCAQGRQHSSLRTSIPANPGRGSRPSSLTWCPTTSRRS